MATRAKQEATEVSHSSILTNSQLTRPATQTVKAPLFRAPSVHKFTVTASSSTQKTIEIPPPTSRDYPVDIQIRIRRDRTQYYDAEIFAQGQSILVPIGISLEDLVTLNKALQQEIQVVASKGMAAAESEARLLAQVGNYAFGRIFSHYGDMIVKLLDRIAQQLISIRPVCIQVTSEDFCLPWELLYPASPNESLDYGHFWGMNHIISRRIIQKNDVAEFVRNSIPIVLRPNLGLLTYDELPHVNEIEIPFFEELNMDGKIHLFHLRILDPDPDKRPEEEKAFKDFLNEPFNLIHFACHASYEDPMPYSYLSLSEEFDITLMNMDTNKIVVNGRPLIIMNACETGNLDPKYTSSFAEAFIRYGARGVVATECGVPDEFAAEFVKQLYACLLAYASLGESLLATRQYFWEKDQNPAGLLYSMYAPPSIRLSQLGE